MIPFDFEYYKPTSIQEAIETFRIIKLSGKRSIFYSGGTEFITFARVNKVTADAIIDIKGILDCHVLEIQDNQLVIGAAVSLNKITESGLFPLLGDTVKKIADHTSRNKITIGGNLKSQLMYREGVLPLLLSESKVKIVGNEGEMILPLEDVFDKELKLSQDQFLVQIQIEKEFLDLPSVNLKKTRFSKVGYPLVSIAALTKNHSIRMAFSGVCEYPFRSVTVEEYINDHSLSSEERIKQAIAHLPSPIVEDIQGSAPYREFVLKNVLFDTIEALECTQ